MNTLFHSMNEHITPPADFKQRVFEKIGPSVHKPRLHPAAAIAAVLALVLLATPVMAACVPPIQELMRRIAPEIAARFSPVQEVCEKNGFRMEVVATAVYGDTAEVYLTFQDTTGQGRLDSHTDAGFRSLLGNRQNQARKEAAAGVLPADHGTIESQYDPEDGTLTTLVSMTYPYVDEQGQPLSIRELFGDKLTVTIDHLFRDVQLYHGPLDPSLGDSDTMTLEAEQTGDHEFIVSGGKVTDFFHSYMRSSREPDPWAGVHSYTLIAPGDPSQAWGDGLAVTGIAYLDGSLHVQTRVQSQRQVREPFAYFSLVSGTETLRYDDRTISFTIPDGDHAGDYREYIFDDISPEELENLTLFCDAGERVYYAGPWSVTFPLVETETPDAPAAMEEPAIAETFVSGG